MTAYESILEDFLSKDDSFALMTAENRAPLRHLSKKMPEKIIDTGITEQTLVGMSAGLALRGRKPVVHALAAFLTMRSFEFIRTDIGIGKLNVKLVGFIPGVLSEANGPTHQALEDISLMRTIPGMQVFSPVDYEDLCIGLPKILNSHSPTYIRYTTIPKQISHSSNFQIGKAETIREGSEVMFLSHGALFNEALGACEWLNGNGISAGVINLRMLQPIDEEAILRTLTSSRLTVVVEDHFVTGGLYSIVSELALQYGIRANVLPIAFNARWFHPCLLKDVLQKEKMNSASLAERILNCLDKKREINYDARP